MIRLTSRLTISRAICNISSINSSFRACSMVRPVSQSLSSDCKGKNSYNDVPLCHLHTSDSFLQRAIGPTTSDISYMCHSIGVNDIDDLITQTIPESIRRQDELSIDKKPKGEMSTLQRLKEISNNNKKMNNYIGMGFSNSFLPAVIRRNIVENPSWYTAYTPYQAEISQGRMEALLNFQTMVCELTGMGVANASLLCEGSAAAEGLSMAIRTTPSNKNVLFVSSSVHPHIIEVILTRFNNNPSVKVLVGDHKVFSFDSKDLAGALVAYPDTYGIVEDFSDIRQQLNKHGGRLVVCADILSLTLLKPPGEWGADVVVGTTQRLGLPLFFGGPHAAFIATTKKHVRNMPGRLIGVSVDSSGVSALRMALQTREQHIRGAAATSNVCTAQALPAVIAGMYGVYHRFEGLKCIAERTRGLAQIFSEAVSLLGYSTHTHTHTHTNTH
eukprot:GHVR01155045.1.p1 GENE.GHVR01155045.1~~GHVR01155045.1.p1  ORF type:complete len:443 (+),score=116.83 GHVR01155045.1:49-1377(+)